jgi:hypothetical protein
LTSHQSPSNSSGSVSSSSSSAHQLFFLPEIGETDSCSSYDGIGNNNNATLQSSSAMVATIPRTPGRWDQIPAPGVAANSSHRQQSSADQIRGWCDTVQSRLENGWPLPLNNDATAADDAAAAAAATKVVRLNDSFLAEMEEFLDFMRLESVKNRIQVEFSQGEKQRQNHLVKWANAVLNNQNGGTT